MTKTIIRRFLIMIPQLLAISLFVFLISYNMPGDPILAMLGETADAEAYAHLVAAWGLDQPWYIQYFRWMQGIVTEFNFGRSMTHQIAVTDLIADAAGNTFRLSLFTLIMIYAIAIPLGLLAAKKQNTWIDKGIILYTFIALAMPTVVLGVVNVFIFGFNLGWFPVRGSVSVLASTPWEVFISQIHHMFLPAFTAAILSTVFLINILRSTVVDIKNSDFIKTARSKGVPERRIYNVHILRNAMLPITPSIGMVVVALLSGSVIIESIFSFPGMGQLFITAMNGRDYAVTNTLVLLFAFLTALGVLLGDILITIVDPRIRIR